LPRIASSSSLAQLHALPRIRIAACTGTHVSVFFGPPRERGRNRVIREAKAKAICASCPSQQICLVGAIERHETSGVWGGTTERERLSPPAIDRQAA
jgi:hypothetical protein